MEDLNALRFFSIMRLLLASWLFFYWIPKKVFPQDYINNALDRVMFNCIHIIAIITLIFPIFIFFRVFGFPFLILFFILIRLAVLKYWYKVSLKNYFEFEIYHNAIFSLMRAIENIKPVISAFKMKAQYAGMNIRQQATPLKIFALLSTAAIVSYTLYIRLLGPFTSLVAAVSDEYQFLYWNQILKMNKLTDVIAGAPYPWGSPVLVYTVNLFAQLNTVVLLNIFPLITLSFTLFTIYYFITRMFDGDNKGTVSFLIAIVFFGIVLPSPVAQIFFGTVFKTADPNVSHLSFLNVYSGPPAVGDIIYDKINPFIFFVRSSTVLSYEVASVFILPYFYFLHKALVTRSAVLLFIYAECLAIMAAIHPGVLIPLFLPSLLIVINAIINCGTDKKTLKRGIIAVAAALGFGSLWLAQVIKYGIPENIGAAAPILDRLFKTKRYMRDVVESSALGEVTLVYVTLPLLILFLSSIILLAFSRFRANGIERANQAAIPLFSLGILFIYCAGNIGLPRLVDHSRLQQGLAFSYALVSAQCYNLFFEKNFFVRFFRARAMLVSLSVVFTFTIAAVALTPRWIDKDDYWKNILSMELKETPYFIFQIEEEFQPLTYTIVCYVEGFSQIVSMGYHINSHDLLTDYDPLEKTVKIPTDYVFIFVENAPVDYFGGGQFWYRWRGDIMMKTKEWVSIYAKNHSNIKMWAKTDQLQIFQIDNRSALEENRDKLGSKPIIDR